MAPATGFFEMLIGISTALIHTKSSILSRPPSTMANRVEKNGCLTLFHAILTLAKAMLFWLLIPISRECPDRGNLAP
jgi:hypothetical protein